MTPPLIRQTANQLLRTRIRPAFTLIELLVVVAVIAVLISILMPALNGARDQAKSAKCLANLRAVTVMMTVYADEYNDGKWMPCSGLTVNPVTGIKDVFEMIWTTRLRTSKIMNRNANFTYCPGNPPPSPFTGDPDKFAYGYRDEVHDSFNLLTWAASADCGPADYPLLADSIHKVSGEQYCSMGDYWAGVRLQHQGKANMAFADGHAGQVDRKLVMNGPIKTWNAFRHVLPSP